VTGSKVGPAADRYSLATMAYEMLTGAFPFEDDSVLEMMYAHVHRDPTPPSSHRPELGSRVDAVLLRGLAKDPDARWESCTALVAALQSALEAGPGPAVERTVVMASPVAATAPIARRKAAPAGATVVMPMAVPAAAAVAVAPSANTVKAPAKSRRRLYAILAAVVLLLLLISSIGLIIAAGTPTLSLSSTTVSPGDTLVVTAAHVPKNQAGEIQLLSRLTTYGFRADVNGNVSREILVPNETVIGDHLVKICWSGTCHAQATLHVVPFGAVVIASPTPGASPRPGVTPGVTPGVSPSPISGRSPTPTSGTSSTGGTGGTKASPTPTKPPPSPTPPQPYVRIGSISTLNGFTVVFHYFGGGTWSVTVVSAGTPHSAGTATVPSGSTYYSQKYATPLGVLIGQTAYVQVCKSGACYNSNTVTVGL
jgi:hypothetical protein